MSRSKILSLLRFQFPPIPMQPIILDVQSAFHLWEQLEMLPSVIRSIYFIKKNRANNLVLSSISFFLLKVFSFLVQSPLKLLNEN